ncbi:MAG: PEGA domain-containing protein [Candidatus Electrothrix sp. YB6]
MRLLISSVLLASFLTCSGCIEDKDNTSQQSEAPQKVQKPQETQEFQEAALIRISPRKIKWNGGQDCDDLDFYNQFHYYELYIDEKLVYRNRLRSTSEEDEPTEWQLPLGQHQIRVCAEGFVPFDKQIEVVGKENRASTIQYFGMVLVRTEQNKDKK